MGKKPYKPRYPYTLFEEALDVYRAEPFLDEVARNKYLEVLGPLIEHCVRRSISVYGGGLWARKDDVLGFVYVQLIESWLPKYFAGHRKVELVKKGVHYLTKSIHGYVIDFVKRSDIQRTVPLLTEVMWNKASPEYGIDDQLWCDELNEAIEREVKEHLALRKRPELVADVVRKIVSHNLRKRYRETGELPHR